MQRDDIADAPPGMLGVRVTFLERDLSEAVEPPDRPEFERLDARAIHRYRALFRAVGQDWLWFSRLSLPEAELSAILADPGIHALALKGDPAIFGTRDIGLLELDLRDGATAYLAFLGTVPDAIGKGFGRRMIEAGFALAYRRGARRIFVNTCSLDHPKALDFYRARGFVATREAIELFEDPRLSGLIPRDAAPHIPLAKR